MLKHALRGFVPSSCFPFDHQCYMRISVLTQLVQKSCDLGSTKYFRGGALRSTGHVVFSLLALLVQKYLLSDLEAAVSCEAAKLMRQLTCRHTCSQGVWRREHVVATLAHLPNIAAPQVSVLLS